MANPLVLTILSDPTALTEAFAAVLTAGYLGRLVFVAREEQPVAVADSSFGTLCFGTLRIERTRSGQTVSESFSKGSVGGSGSRRSSLKRKKFDLYEKMLRLFAVGEHIALPKRSLRCQDGVWRRA